MRLNVRLLSFTNCTFIQKFLCGINYVIQAVGNCYYMLIILIICWLSNITSCVRSNLVGGGVSGTDSRFIARSYINDRLMLSSEF